MKRIVVSCLKGGVGKSTISLNLAQAFKENLNVAILDIDTQKTTTSLAGEYVKTYRRDDNIGEHDILIIDTPPYMDAALESTFISADLIIIPAKPSFADIDALSETVKLVEKARFKNKKIKAVILINMEDSRSVLSQSIKPVLEQMNLPIFRTVIETRTNYIRSLIAENGIYSFKDKKAIDEFNSFVKEVYSFLI